MRRKVLISLLAGVILIGGCFALRAMAPSAPSSAQDASQEVLASPSLTAEGVIVPVRKAALSFPGGGILQQLTVGEGEGVERGKLLARLDASDLELAVQAARDSLALAEAQLAQAGAGPRPEEVAMSEAAVASAQADLASARANLNELLAGASERDMKRAELKVEQAKNQLWGAQGQRDAIKGGSFIGPGEKDAAEAAVGQAHVAVQLAQLELEEIEDEPQDKEVAVARAQVESAQAQLARAEAELEMVKAGPRPEDISVAEAGVNQARTALRQAESNLEDAQILAPFTGTTVIINAHEGEMVTAGAPVITLADLAELQMETTDLDEWGAVDVHVGQAVKIVVNAFKDKALTGRVTAIAPRGEVLDTGDTAYTVAITLDRQDPALRWGMTTKVEFLEE